MSAGIIPATTYVELQVTSHFSFLRGASSPEELFSAAALLGHRAMGQRIECQLAARPTLLLADGSVLGGGLRVAMAYHTSITH